MIKTFKELPKTKTVDFDSLAAGNCFSFNKTYYMKLITEYKCDDDCCYNSINLKSGVLTFSPRRQE